MSLQVLSVRMNLVSSCPVEIRSYDEDQCSSNSEGSTALPLSLPVIVGGAVGVVIVVTVLCIVVILVALVVRRGRRKKKSSRNLRQNK